MFDELSRVTDLSQYLQNTSETLFAFGNNSYEQIKQDKDNIESFILLDYEKIRSLDFANSQNRAFIFLIYDLCERLELSVCLQYLCHLFIENQIKIGHRLLAANLFSFNISEAPQYIDKFDEICNNLIIALEEEEDDDKKVLATFANYYLTVLGRQKIWIQKLQEKISISLNNYSFLSNNFISELLSFDTSNFEQCKSNIQRLKDELFGRINVFISIPTNDFLIEKSDYSIEIANIPHLSFKDLRQIAIDNVVYGSKLDNRGVTPLTSVEDMFIYLKSYGNMHYAKMISALKIFPLNLIEEEIEIIDWGCGQALASVIFFEYLKNKHIIIAPRITLIEPSEIVIKRAALHVKMLCKSPVIRTICKYIDDLSEEDVATNKHKIKIHLFSNILDVELFSISKLENLISKSQHGTNYFICVSPNINDLKTERIDGFKRYFEINYNSTFELIGEETNGGMFYDAYWNCNNNYNGNKGIFCNHQEHGCASKWTRVMKVFKVEL